MIMEAIAGIFPIFLSIFDDVPIIRAILSGVLVFFIPGFAWTFVFWNKSSISYIERIVLSFGLSIALVTLSVVATYYLLDISINMVNSIIIIAIVTAIPLVWCLLRRFIWNRIKKASSDQGK